MGPTAGALISPKTYKRHHAMHSLSCSTRSQSNTFVPHPLNLEPELPMHRDWASKLQIPSRKAFCTIAALTLAWALSSASPADSSPTAQPAGSTAPISAAQLYALPMQFEPNAGQTDDPVLFLSRGRGFPLFLTPTQAVLSLRATAGNDKANRQHRTGSAENKIAQADLQMTLLGANPQSRVVGLDQLPGTVNYFVGNDPSQWRSAIPTFAKVKCHQVYPGVDLVYYGNQRQVEYDFLVGAHADPARIAIAFAGAERLELDEKGDLIAQLAGGTVRWHKPVAYQQAEAGRQEVAAKFVLNNRQEVGFELGAYDASRPLIIDPQLVYATYLGGSGSDYIGGIAVNGNDFAGGIDNFGGGLTYAGGLAIDSNGNAFITGATASPNFPTTSGAFQAANNGGYSDAFVTKLGPFGTNLVYSTYLGGPGQDSGNAIAVDNAGNAYVAGATYSLSSGKPKFPTTSGAYQANNNGGSDAFITKFDTNGAVVYCTFLGGSTSEAANAIAVDSNGNACVAGVVQDTTTIIPNLPSSDFLTSSGNSGPHGALPNTFQTNFNRGITDGYFAGVTDGFVSKMNSNGTALLFSTFLGGGFEDTAYAIAVDSSNRVYVMGESSSTNFLTLNAAQPANGGFGVDPDFPLVDAFVAVFETNGASLRYSTYLGGSGYESGFSVYRFGMALDQFGDIYVTGYTDSSSDALLPDLPFPLTPGADQTNSAGSSDAFVAKINPTVPGPSSLIYSTLLGGDGNEWGTAIAVDTNGNFYVAGFTSSSTNFPVPNGYDRTYNGGTYDGFVAKFSSPPDLSVAMIPSIEPVVVGSNLTFAIQVNNNGRTTFTGASNFVQLATNFQILSVSTTFGSFNTNGGLLTFSIGTLPNNANAKHTIVVATLSPATTSNTATLTSIETPSLEPNTNNNLASVVSTIQGIADVTLSLSAAPNPGLVTSNLSYSINLTNKGPWPVTSLTVTDALPPSVTFVSATNTQGASCSFDGVATVTCTLTNLAKNGTATVNITVSPTATGLITNLANATPFELDPNPTNNTASIVTTINPLADLALSITGSPNPVAVGSNLIYTVLVTNLGPSTTTNVVLTDPLPPGTVFVSTTSSQGTSSQSNGIVTCNLGSLVSNATATVAITVRPSGAGTITNTASVTSAAADPISANNSASVVTTVVLSAPLLSLSPTNLNF